MEANEGFTVTLSAPSAGTTITTAAATGTIVNDDVSSLAIAATDASKAEGDTGSTPFTFTVTRSGNTSGASSVTYTVTGSGANAATAADFTGAALPTMRSAPKPPTNRSRPSLPARRSSPAASANRGTAPAMLLDEEEMIERLGEIIGEVRGGASALANAASQVASTSQSLSQGTSEQAASVEETTATPQRKSHSRSPRKLPRICALPANSASGNDFKYSLKPETARS